MREPDRLAKLSVFVGVTLVSWGINYALQYPDRLWLQVLPSAMGRLTATHWKAAGVTFIATICSWAAAVGVGSWLGGVAAAMLVRGEEGYDTPRWTAERISEFYTWIWIVPFALTVNLLFAIGMRLCTDNGIPRQVVGASVILACGVILGGYQVFDAVYSSVRNASEEERHLIHSLFSTALQTPRRGRMQWRHAWITARRLRDCEIQQFCVAVKNAFYLSLVGVMIFEMVTPSAYEWFLPQSGIGPRWLGGIGRLVLSAQQDYAYEIIAGLIWVVIVFAALVGMLIDWYVGRRWLVYYKARAVTEE